MQEQETNFMAIPLKACGVQSSIRRKRRQRRSLRGPLFGVRAPCARLSIRSDPDLLFTASYGRF